MCTAPCKSCEFQTSTSHFIDEVYSASFNFMHIFKIHQHTYLHTIYLENLYLLLALYLVVQQTGRLLDGVQKAHETSIYFQCCCLGYYSPRVYIQQALMGILKVLIFLLLCLKERVYYPSAITSLTMNKAHYAQHISRATQR